VQSDDGHPDSSVLATRDVHESVERERALRTSRRRLLDALDASLDRFGILEARREGATIVGFVNLVLNAAGARSFERPREELLGRDILEVSADCKARGLWDALAGDEFVLVLRDLPAGWEPGGFVRRADQVLGRPVDVGPGIVWPSASVGVVVVDPAADDRTPETLLADADRAMYGAKRARGLRPERFRVVS
jgi:predicted signal transduction protein with EAL and GGDEF domain